MNLYYWLLVAVAVWLFGIYVLRFIDGFGTTGGRKPTSMWFIVFWPINISFYLLCIIGGAALIAVVGLVKGLLSLIKGIPLAFQPFKLGQLVAKRIEEHLK